MTKQFQVISKIPKSKDAIWGDAYQILILLNTSCAFRHIRLDVVI